MENIWSILYFLFLNSPCLQWSKERLNQSPGSSLLLTLAQYCAHQIHIRHSLCRILSSYKLENTHLLRKTCQMDILSGFLWHPWISNINGNSSDFINLSHLLKVCWVCKKSWSQLQTCETDLELNVINSESEIMMKLLWEDVTWLVLRNSKGSKFKSIIILIITDCGYPICVMSQISCNVWKMFLIHMSCFLSKMKE